ncbi:MAG: DNA alkylation repair protein [Calditrichaeota bacterium]|nr:DNA alkylation repair protein [Calditrichota bacterium]
MYELSKSSSLWERRIAIMATSEMQYERTTTTIS